jgi:uncharacterized protein (DUF1684 family)
MKLLPLPLAVVLSAMASLALAADADKPSIETSPQPAGTTISIDSVNIPDGGFVVIHASDEEGDPIAPESIGHVAVEPGTHENVSVELDEEVASGDKVFVMLHEDTGEEGTYEFGADNTDVDLPTVYDGKAVVVPMEIE